jgi:RNA polymerase sigma factor (TIGR02999 family)
MGPGPNRAALDRLYSVIYEELRRLARNYLKREYAAEVSPTTLVHEVWIKLNDSSDLVFESELHLKCIAGKVMHQLLVDAARRRGAAIHGGALMRVTLGPDMDVPVNLRDRDVLALESALELLSKSAPQQAELVEARFFAGLSCGECAQLFGVSESTIMRDWRATRAWLAHELRGPDLAGSSLDSQ